MFCLAPSGPHQLLDVIVYYWNASARDVKPPSYLEEPHTVNLLYLPGYTSASSPIGCEHNSCIIEYAVEKFIDLLSNRTKRTVTFASSAPPAAEMSYTTGTARAGCAGFSSATSVWRQVTSSQASPSAVTKQIHNPIKLVAPRNSPYHSTNRCPGSYTFATNRLGQLNKGRASTAHRRTRRQSEFWILRDLFKSRRRQKRGGESARGRTCCCFRAGCGQLELTPCVTSAPR